MPFPAHMLNEGEEVVLYRHPHWTFIASGFVLLGVAVAVAAVISILLPEFFWVGLIIVLFGLLGAGGRYLRWRTTEFVVSTDRIIVRQGVLAKYAIEIPLDKVMNISYRQSLYERLLGTGDLVVESAGENGQQAFTDVSNPSYVQNVIYRQGELYEAGRSGAIRSKAPDDGDGEDPGMSIPEQIEKLATLRDKGILSDDEFQEKKQTLLDRM